MKICFLVHDHRPLLPTDNAMMLADAARELGHEAAFVPANSLACHDGEVLVPACDMVWVLSVGGRKNFLDKIQLLMLLAEKTPVINSPHALFYLHSKISLSILPPPLRGRVGVGGDPRSGGTSITPPSNSLPQGEGGLLYPETHISSDAETLWSIAQEKASEWVVKPPGDMLGQGIAKLSDRAQLNGGYHILQRYIPEIEQGEKRVLVAGGEIVGQYKRYAKAGDFRTNLHQGASAELCELTGEERAACTRIAGYLLEKGVVFAGLDICWPYLIEWNVISPGGMGTIAGLGGKNLAKTVMERVLSSSQAP